MARNDEKKIRELEILGARLGYFVAEQSSMVGELELASKFHWIAAQLVQTLDEKTPAKRKRRLEISKRTKELGDVIREKHIQYQLLAFRCIDEHDECVRKRKREKKSPYLCFLALFICLGNSMKALLAAIVAGAALLR